MQRIMMRKNAIERQQIFEGCFRVFLGATTVPLQPAEFLRYVFGVVSSSKKILDGKNAEHEENSQG
jgi:hypothetical protein